MKKPTQDELSNFVSREVYHNQTSLIEDVIEIGNDQMFEEED